MCVSGDSKWNHLDKSNHPKCLLTDYNFVWHLFILSLNQDVKWAKDVLRVLRVPELSSTCPHYPIFTSKGISFCFYIVYLLYADTRSCLRTAKLIYGTCQVCVCAPVLILTLGKQVGLWVQGQPGLHREKRNGVFSENPYWNCIS